MEEVKEPQVGKQLYNIPLHSELRANGKYYKLGTDEEVKESIYTVATTVSLDELNEKEKEHLILQHKLLMDMSLMINIVARQTIL